MRTYANYNDNDIINGVSQVKSIAGLLRFLGIKPIGGNYANIKRKLQRLNLNCEHWTGQAWNRGERLKDWSDYSRHKGFRKHLIQERGNKCEECGSTTWLNKTINLEIHHKDGNRGNNNLDNLALLCPNCHSYTDNFRNKKNPISPEEKKKRAKKTLSDNCSCGQLKLKSSIRCRKCADINKIDFVTTKIKWVDNGRLHWLVWNYSMIQVSKMLGISDVSIRKRCRVRNIKCPTLGFWQKFARGKIIDYQI